MIKALVITIDSNLPSDIWEIVHLPVLKTASFFKFPVDFMLFGNTEPSNVIFKYDFSNFYQIPFDFDKIAVTEIAEIISEIITQRNYNLVFIPSFPRLKYYSSISGAVAAKSGYAFVNEVFNFEFEGNFITAKRASLSGILEQRLTIPVVIGLSYFKNDVKLNDSSNKKFQTLYPEDFGFNEQMLAFSEIEDLKIESSPKYTPSFIKTSEELNNWFS